MKKNKKYILLSAVVTHPQMKYLKKRSKEEDRSTSAIIRDLLTKAIQQG